VVQTVTRPFWDPAAWSILTDTVSRGHWFVVENARQQQALDEDMDFVFVFKHEKVQTNAYLF